ncbi:phosphoesterase, MJ0936 family [Clostridium pasteurianum DSM 525 = ATCC 6013]|uniref:Phosphoesterase n=1 Tax=Clostridium pasteurianum DSM 525 = ATCC 6013 TaxID=1262449 RepID=A0A0H3JAI1_CLOPA|nr:phosphodiesterase [Clostridium pasteurianum]AJA48580.1 phosphoesterase, MJ0936 family [Clostridium pasteurianum DSM 525 = ATCC 6013]AJA52568.1 phosphoesterase, MJ0936 family [Clostridium pasteurianum DSM 525 = ATCC 6013]AOZ75811.1 phosphodiesterase [Clostridium pasteurianum DSM 525 = ATCC 6013]AOZ79607.1 phosphodiesterase [Clostridium pasteurianum]ELP57942.1 phosphodiesterase [Clostridium pasteurianum DSM 525 = ATCC 6013]
MNKLFFISDIHGSLYYLKKILEIYESEKADYIIILGDELYHGPRNPLPKDYNPKEVSQILNTYKDKIIAVRGNCDSEVDQMVLEYPVMDTYSIFLYNNRRLFLTHGHVYNRDKLPYLNSGDAIIYGHTHIPLAEKQNDIFVINPGSISMPKEGNPNSYGILDDDIFKVKDLEGNTIKEISFNK